MEQELICDASLMRAGYFKWRTCLRTIYFCFGNQSSWSKALPPAIEDRANIYRGFHAYRFLLEVISGMHSPLLGETEVLGQFRRFLQNSVNGEGNGQKELRKLAQWIQQDAKLVRRSSLLNMGARSYGSAVRKHLKSVDEICVLGAGTLANDIVPWIVGNESAVRVFARDPEKARESFADFAVQVDPFWKKKKSKNGRSSKSLAKKPNRKVRTVAVIVAAPIATCDLERWLHQSEFSFVQIIDLREEGNNHPIRLGSVPVLMLKTFFAEMQQSLAETQTIRMRAQQVIAQRVARRAELVEHRPFGWDDLCA